MAGPGIAAGATCDGRVGLHEVGPTLLELAGAAPLEKVDGRPFTPLLLEPDATEGYRRAYAEYFGTRFQMTQRVVWEDHWKLVFNGFDEDELYDLAADPHELQNLADDPQHAERRRALMRLAWGYMQASEDRTLLQTH